MRGKSVLAADDDEDLLAFIEAVVKDDGGEFTGARNGEDCLNLLEHQTPHLILLDVEMGGMNGISTLERIRERHPKLTSKVVFLTVHKSLARVNHARALDVAGFILKPITPERLRERLNDALYNRTPLQGLEL